MSDQTPSYKIGDVVNGHRWNGATWEPVPPGWGSIPNPGMPQYQIGQVVNGHRWNGAAWEPLAASWGAAPSPNKPWYQSPLGIGLMVLGALVVVGLAIGSGQESPTASTQPEQATVATAAPSEQVAASEEPVEPEPEAEPAQEKPAAGVGTPVRDGKFEFTVTDVRTGVKSVGNQYLNQKAQGQFTLVTVRVENIGDESQMFDGSNVFGTDTQGREVSSDSGAGIYANDDTEAFLNEINPGNAVTAVVVFDLPQGERLEALDVHDSPFSGGAEISLQ